MNGVIYIDDNLICINSYGKIKVWLNNNLTINSPEVDRLYPKPTTPNEAQASQIAMVDQIIRTVWLHISPAKQQFISAYETVCNQRTCKGISFF
jgi:hypothetical protein